MIAFVRSDMCFTVVTDLENLSAADRSRFRTESLTLRVKLGKSWITITGVYRTPSVPKSQWKMELNALFDATAAVTNDISYIGDFNCDLMLPDKPPKDGRDLSDLLEIYNLKNLIDIPTRIGKTSETLLDLILINNIRRILTSGVVDVHLSGHSLIYTFFRASAPRLRSRKICLRSLKHFDSALFRQDLNNAPYQIMEVFDDVDDKYYVF